MKKVIFLFLLLFLAVWLLPEAFSKTIENEYILKLSNEKSLDVINYFYQKDGGKKEILHTFKSGNLHVQLGGKELEYFMKNFGSNIKYIEPNYIYHTMAAKIPDYQWALKEDYGVYAQKAWEITKGSKEVVVAVIDTGVDYTHIALKKNMWVNKKEIPNNGKDDDGNGYVDDVYGYDFANDDNDPMPGHSHGTHCAGIIAANHPQILGIAPNVRVMAIQFLGEDGSGSLAGAIKAIEYGVDNGAHILSNSWGGGPYSETLKEAIEYAEKKDIIFVAAAGNEWNNNDKRPSYPASYKVDNIISVGASTKEGTKAYFSNYGQESVHVFAPGYKIMSTVKDNKLAEYSGSSMSTPYVSGVAALILSEFPYSNYLEIKNKILNGVQKTTSFKDISISGGVLNAYNSLK